MKKPGPGKLGVFIRQLNPSIHGTPALMAAKAKDHGVDYVAFLIAWQELRERQEFNVVDLARYARAMRDQGIDVHLWVYPWESHEELMVKTFVKRTEELRQEGGRDAVQGWIIDPELGYKWFDRPETVIRQEAQFFMNELLNAMDENLNLGVTSYGLVRGHPNFPWEVFLRYGWHCPQVYGFRPAQLTNALASWSSTKAAMIPAIAGFGEFDEDRLEEYGREVISRDGVDGIIVWSWRQLSSREWAILGRLRDLFPKENLSDE